MANAESLHETVLEAGTKRSRLAQVYAESLLASALKQSPGAVEAVGDELASFVREAGANPSVAAFLASPAVGKRAKTAAIEAALTDRASGLLRGLIGVLGQNDRLDLLRNVSVAYRQLLDQRAGRVWVKVTAAVPLSDAQTGALTASLKDILNREPMLDVRVDPDLLGGLVVQVGDTVIDTSVRSRLQAIRTLLLDGGNSHGR